MRYGAEKHSDAVEEPRGDAQYGTVVQTPVAANTAIADTPNANAEAQQKQLEHKEASHAPGGLDQDGHDENGTSNPACPSVPRAHTSQTIMEAHTKESPSPASSTVPITRSSTVDIESNHEAVQYPEGSLEAWSVVFGSFCGMLAAFGLMNAVGVYQTYLSTNQLSDYDESTIAWIFGLYIFLAFFCGVQIGPVFDSKGPRYLVFTGSVLLLAAVFLVAESTRKWCER